MVYVNGVFAPCHSYAKLVMEYIAECLGSRQYCRRTKSRVMTLNDNKKKLLILRQRGEEWYIEHIDQELFQQLKGNNCIFRSYGGKK